MSTIARTAAHSVPAHCPPAHCLLDRSLPHRARMHMVWISYEHTRGACLCRRTHGPDKEQPHQGQPDLHRPGTEWAGPAMFQGNSRDDSCCTTDGRSTWLCSRAYRPAPALCRFRQRLPQWTRRAPFVSFKHGQTTWRRRLRARFVSRRKDRSKEGTSRRKCIASHENDTRSASARL